jgi:ABC-2 type transport system permease protein
MTVYIFMVYVTSSVVAISISEWVSEDVVKGTVAMQLIKPIDYRLSLIARALGQMVYRFLLPAVFIWIGLELYKCFVLGLAFTPIVNIVLYIFSCLLSFLIFVLFDFCVGMIAFFTSYIFGLFMVKEALMSFLTGQLIPLSFFPAVVQRIFDFLPFSSMIYTPVMIYLGKYQGTELAWVLLRQLAWVLILYGLGTLIWNRVTKRLVVLGG